MIFFIDTESNDRVSWTVLLIESNSQQFIINLAMLGFFFFATFSFQFYFYCIVYHGFCIVLLLINSIFSKECLIKELHTTCVGPRKSYSIFVSISLFI